MTTKRKKVSFQDNLSEELQPKINRSKIDTVEDVVKPSSDTLAPKEIRKKASTKKSFPVYMLEEDVLKLDRIGNELGYSRNELINKLVKKGLEAYGL